ncbi:chorismate synthase [Paludisphaera borealis]|uniref:Chorismate synthase n=1 Tax=Paludisphaera borealis TaxID=1387353 RepID=A0A1U7CV19_9BACT|nr:chorismate synthase [Paludisphaera borealis]APW62723.1 Chorismate synthase [Paludisphaera borealis]
MLRYLTAGESHGPALTAIVEGFPSGVAIDKTFIDRELERRQGGYGRGKRQKLETDRVIIDSGTFHGVSTGAPITLRLINNDAKLERLAEPASPRGGHIDLAGSINYQTGIRQVLERASARETALRVAVGALARLLLRAVGIEVFGYVSELGGIAAPPLSRDLSVRDASPVYTLNPEADVAIVAAIDAAQKAGDTLGGVVEAVVTGCPMGLGSHVQYDRKLDARLAAAVMSIQAIKAVEIGLGVEAARRPGSKVMDPIQFDPDHAEDDRRFGFRRPTNNAGGIEGGTSNGEPIVVRAFKKPISTLAARGPSVNMATKSPTPASYERSDVCAVPAASVIVENVVAFEIASALVEKYVGTSLEAVQAALAAIHTLNRQHLASWGEEQASG